MKKSNTFKSAIAAVVLATAIAAPAAVAPTTAQALTPNEVVWGQTDPRAHWEGEKVTVTDQWGNPVYAEWHRGSSGHWWATFYTYNYTKVWAVQAPTGQGWAFFAYDKSGDFMPLFRCEESSSHGLYGPQGVSSHWRDEYGRWY